MSPLWILQITIWKCTLIRWLDLPAVSHSLGEYGSLMSKWHFLVICCLYQPCWYWSSQINTRAYSFAFSGQTEISFVNIFAPSSRSASPSHNTDGIDVHGDCCWCFCCCCCCCCCCCYYCCRRCCLHFLLFVLLLIFGAIILFADIFFVFLLISLLSSCSLALFFQILTLSCLTVCNIAMNLLLWFKFGGTDKAQWSGSPFYVHHCNITTGDDNVVTFCNGSAVQLSLNF